VKAVTILLVLLASAILGAACGSAAVRAAGSGAMLDRGTDRPPARLAEDGKSIWMTEWAACWRVSMGRLSNVLKVPVRPGQTPQQAAKVLAHRAVFLLYETQPELVAAADGCRNGILWRYYHPNNKR
jgi:hypothetical protein